MKLSKKVLAAFSVAALLATASVFVSCSDEEGTEGVLEISGSTATVNYTNDSNDFARAFKTLRLDRKIATCKIVYDKGQSKGEGVIGFMFDEKNEKLNDARIADILTNNNSLTTAQKTKVNEYKGEQIYDFTIAGINYTDSSEASVRGFRTYVSTFKNVDASTLEKGKSFLNVYGGDAEVKDSANNYKWAALNDVTSTNNVYTVYIKMETQADGSIKLGYYKEEDTEGNKIKEGKTPFKEYTVLTENTTITENKDVAIGFYANVYANSTLVGSIGFYDLHGNAIAIEE